MIFGNNPSCFQQQYLDYCKPTGLSFFTPRAMKRVWVGFQSFFLMSNFKNPEMGNSEDGASKFEPLKKRALYEDKMSKTLQNIHIDQKPGVISNTSIIEEDWGLNEIATDSVPTPASLLDADFLPVNNESIIASTSEIILSDHLKSFINRCKEQSDISFLKPKIAGNELMLYVPKPLPQTNTLNNPEDELKEDIRDRIKELDPSEASFYDVTSEDFMATDNDDQIFSEQQIITFPEDDNEEIANSSDGSTNSQSSGFSSSESRKSARAILSASRTFPKVPSRTPTPCFVTLTTSEPSGISATNKFFANNNIERSNELLNEELEMEID